MPLGNDLPVIHERKISFINRNSIRGGEKSQVSSGQDGHGEIVEDEEESDVLEMISYMID